MGMFTTILAPDQNLSIQIKCGWDTCDVFSVGQTVPWHIIEECPNQGYLFDDVYLGIGGTPKQDDDHSWDDYWVVIKNHVVQEVFLYQEGDQYPDMRTRFQIQDPPEDLWSEEVWVSYRKECAEREKAFEEFEASIAHLPPVERFARILHRSFGRPNYRSLAEQIFTVEPLPEGVLPIYDKDPDAVPNTEDE